MSKTEDLLRRLRAGSAVLVLVACGALGASWFVDIDASRSLLVTTSAAMATIFAALHLLTRLVVWRSRQRRLSLVALVEEDTAPVLCSDPDGTIFALNPAATERFGQQDGTTLARALEPLLANPGAVVERLRASADADGAAREDLAVRGGQIRLAVHRVPGGLIWRIEDIGERQTRGPDGGTLPLLTFGPSGTILYMNDALRGAIGRRPKHLRDLFENTNLQNGGINRMIGAEGVEPVRTILSSAANGRQDAIVVPAGEVPDERVGLDDLPVALMRLDGGGRVIFANELARELLPAIGSGTEDRLAAMVEGLGRSVREWVSEAASGRGFHRAEVVRVTGAEVETYLQVTLGRPLDDPNGGLLAVLNDATEMKTLEAQFVQSQKMQAIGQLAGGVAHDFNNLLTAISGHCDLLLLRHNENDEDFADLTQITHNANRAAALVGQLLAFSRKQNLEMEPIDLREALGDLAHLLNRLVGERVTLRLEHDPALIPIIGDRRQLEQVLMNLVVNARDAMPDGGEILIETRCSYLDAAMKRDRVTVPAGQYVVLEVSDQGCGISTDNLTRIFEPFFTTKRPGEGTGLGLSMAYGIIKQSGGYIFADSTVGGGTRFSLYFPAMSPEAAAPAAGPAVRSDVAGASGPTVPPIAGKPRIADTQRNAAPESAGAASVLPDDPAPDGAVEIDRIRAAVAAARPAVGDGAEAAPAAREVPCEPPAVTTDPATQPCAGKEKDRAKDEGGASPQSGSTAPGKPVVLLVEDEAPVRAFASRALRLRGYEVMEAENAESALEQLSDETLSVDLFVTDVMMPGLDGPSWVREALKTRPNVRTVFISGYTQDALSETSQPVPNALFLPKPFSLSDLTRTVEKALL